jgi:hypothetical protein
MRSARRSPARSISSSTAFRRGGRLFYVGAGTSGRLGVLDASEMPPTYGTDPRMVQGIIAGGLEALVRAQEGREDHPEDGAREIDAREVGRTISCSASRRPARRRTCTARCGARGSVAHAPASCCAPIPTEELIETHDVVIAPLVGPEVITGSTRMKAGTATKMVLNTITTASMVRLGQGVRQPDGGPAGHLREAARPGRAHPDGDARRRPPEAAALLEARGRSREDGDRDGTARRDRGRSAPSPRGGRRRHRGSSSDLGAVYARRSG